MFVNEQCVGRWVSNNNTNQLLSTEPNNSGGSLVNSSAGYDSMSSSFGSVVLEPEEYLRMKQSYRDSFTASNAFGYNGNGILFGQQNEQQQFGIEDLVRCAKDNGIWNRELQQQMAQNEQFHLTVLQLVVESREEILLQLANDCNAHYIFKKLIENECDAGNADLQKLFDRLENVAFKMTLNRYACRVIINLVEHLPALRVKKLLSGDQFKGNETALVTDQNGNHFLQRIVNNFEPEVYAIFVNALAQSSNLTTVFENKYGCRVIQCILERVVFLLGNNKRAETDEAVAFNEAVAFKILNELLYPILDNACSLASNEYANYLVQFVIKSPFLKLQRRYIVTHHLHKNVLNLARGKYSSHVVEQAMINADPQCLEALFAEVLEGYKPIRRDGQIRTALHCMLFNQYANYVVQQMIKIATKVRQGQHCGNPGWLDQIALCVFDNEEVLSRYSSGKKIIEMLKRGPARAIQQKPINTNFSVYPTLNLPPPPFFPPRVIVNSPVPLRAVRYHAPHQVWLH